MTGHELIVRLAHKDDKYSLDEITNALAALKNVVSQLRGHVS